MLQSEITGDGMDAVASEISLVERSRRCAIHIFTQTRFLEVTLIMGGASSGKIRWAATYFALPCAMTPTLSSSARCATTKPSPLQ